MSKDSHLYSDFPLPFACQDKALYEIPYGTIERGACAFTPIPPDAPVPLSIHDEWPCINWFACTDHHHDFPVIVMNRGLPGCRVVNGHMQISHLRSPSEEAWNGFDTSEMVDHGRHTFEYAVTTCAGSADHADPVNVGLRYNTFPVSIPAEVKMADHPPTHSYLQNTAANVVLSAVKRADDGSRILRMYEAYGKVCSDTLSVCVSETDPLEYEDKKADVLVYHPFEIKTLRIHE